VCVVDEVSAGLDVQHGNIHVFVDDHSPEAGVQTDAAALPLPVVCIRFSAAQRYVAARGPDEDGAQACREA
jgi:hypothetical protein